MIYTKTITIGNPFFDEDVDDDTPEEIDVDVNYDCEHVNAQRERYGDRIMEINSAYIDIGVLAVIHNGVDIYTSLSYDEITKIEQRLAELEN